MASRHGVLQPAIRAIALLGLLASMVSARPAMSAEGRNFRLEEATIADVHRAILARELTSTQLVTYYLKRIEAYNGACVNGVVDAKTGYVLGDIEPKEKAGRLGALMTLNLRGKRSKTDSDDNNPDMPDALETAKALDEEFTRTGKLKGPLHGIPFVIKDQFDTFDMRTTSGAVAAYANDRPPKDSEVVARLRKAGAIILAKGNMGEYASGDRSTYGGTTCNPYDTSRSAGRSSGVSSHRTAASLLMKRVLKQSTMKPRFDNSVQAILFRLLAVRCATRNATCGACPLSGRYIAALTRPSGTNSGWLCAKDCAGKASAAAMVSEHAPKTCPSLMAFLLVRRLPMT
jgi:hypothetical protein